MPRFAIAYPAAAKINLYLHVVGRRPDGYHLLDTMIAFAGVFDTVAVEPSDDLRLEVEGPFAAALSDEADNLVLRAARQLAAAAEVEPKASIRLTKRLPVAAGLGGGSADAAAALMALGILWRLQAGRFDPSPLAASLGADVPMCLDGRAAFAGGIGEELAPTPLLPPAWLVLANPGTPLSTPAVFARRDAPFSQPARFDAMPADAAELAALLAERRNDLTEPAIALQPAIGRVLDVLAAQPGSLLARMSGSGATCFALFGEAEAAETAAQAVAREHPDWWVVATTLEDDALRLQP